MQKLYQMPIVSKRRLNNFLQTYKHLQEFQNISVPGQIIIKMWLYLIISLQQIKSNKFQEKKNAD